METSKEFYAKTAEHVKDRLCLIDGRSYIIVDAVDLKDTAKSKSHFGVLTYSMPSKFVMLSDCKQPTRIIKVRVRSYEYREDEHGYKLITKIEF